MIFYVTFMQYHPLRDNWIEIEAPDNNTARRAVVQCFRDKWAFLYSKKTFDPKHFPGGKAGRTIISDSTT